MVRSNCCKMCKSSYVCKQAFYGIPIKNIGFVHTNFLMKNSKEKKGNNSFRSQKLDLFYIKKRDSLYGNKQACKVLRNYRLKCRRSYMYKLLWLTYGITWRKQCISPRHNYTWPEYYNKYLQVWYMNFLDIFSKTFLTFHYYFDDFLTKYKFSSEIKKITSLSLSLF
jgi:hypothetical protein